MLQRAMKRCGTAKLKRVWDETIDSVLDDNSFSDPKRKQIKKHATDHFEKWILPECDGKFSESSILVEVDDQDELLPVPDKLVMKRLTSEQSKLENEIESSRKQAVELISEVEKLLQKSKMPGNVWNAEQDQMRLAAVGARPDLQEIADTSALTHLIQDGTYAAKAIHSVSKSISEELLQQATRLKSNMNKQ